MSTGAFISDVFVMHGQPPTGVVNINQGFGQPTYLTSTRTANRTLAARGISIVTTTVEDTSDLDYAKGDGRTYFRYILTHRRLGNTPSPIARVYTCTSQRGDGYTGDLNRGRGGPYLYICWDFAPGLASFSAEEGAGEDSSSEAGMENSLPQPLAFANVEELLKNIEEKNAGGEGAEESEDEVLIPLEHVEVEPKLLKASSDE